MHLIHSIIAVDHTIQQADEIKKIKHLLSLLPHLLFCFEKIQYYYKLTENPGVTAVFFNEVGPTYSTVEFFTMIAGSLIRACIGENTKYGTNTLFIQEAKKISIELPHKKEFTNLYDLLKKIQEWRGKIAHVEAEAPGSGNQQYYYEAFSVQGLNRKYYDYVTACKDHILKIMVRFERFINNNGRRLELDKNLYEISKVKEIDSLSTLPLILFNKQPIFSKKIYVDITASMESDELRTAIGLEIQATYPDRSVVEILPISPDGNCMYNTIIQGIQRLPLNYNGDRGITLEELRREVAARIIKAPEEATAVSDSFQGYVELLELQLQASVIDQDFAGFSGRMLDNLMSLRGLSDEDILNGIREYSLVDQYIEMIEENQAWGGNVELGIMSRILDVQFVIHRRDAAAPHIENHTGRENAYAIHMDYTGDHYNLILSNSHLFIENNIFQETPIQPFNNLYLEQNALYLESAEYPLYTDNTEDSSNLVILMGLILLIHKCDDIYF